MKITSDSKKRQTALALKPSVRTAAFLTLIFFCVSCVKSTPSSAANADAFSHPLPAAKSLQTLSVPSSLGRIVDSTLRASSKDFVILIQDAHAIPQAQKHIRDLIRFFAEDYGIRYVGVEGAKSKLDLRLLSSFPDKEKLNKLVQDYLDQGELPGSAAALLADEKLNVYGLEDWDLYLEGIRSYLDSLKISSGLAEELSHRAAALESRKEGVYSPELLKIDRALAGFGRNKTGLQDVLGVLGQFKKPEAGGDLALITEESKSAETDSDFRSEVGRLAETVKKNLERTGAAKLPSFNQKDQAFRTSQISAAEFAEYLLQVTSDGRQAASERGLQQSRQNLSRGLSVSISNRRRLRDIEGTKFFREFEAYAAAVKETVFRNDEERAIDRESRELDLLGKLSRLELTREEWEELKNLFGRMGVKEYGSEINYRNQMAFYQNAEERERKIFENFIRLFCSNKNSDTPRLRHSDTDSISTTMMIAGGFHAQGLIERFKQSGIDYVLIQPAVDSIPAQSGYEAQMRGEVSWKNYFRSENGRVSVYEAFVRAARDQLLSYQVTKSPGHPQKKQRQWQTGDVVTGAPVTLKTWRDQIIRGLSDEKRIAESGKYTKYLDELTENQERPEEKYARQKRSEEFFERLKELEARGEISAPSILKLLKPSTITPLVSGPAIADSSVVSPGSLIHVSSELRAVNDPVSSQSKTDLANPFKAFVIGHLNLLQRSSGNVKLAELADETARLHSLDELMSILTRAREFFLSMPKEGNWSNVPAAFARKFYALQNFIEKNKIFLASDIHSGMLFLYSYKPIDEIESALEKKSGALLFGTEARQDSKYIVDVIRRAYRLALNTKSRLYRTETDEISKAVLKMAYARLQAGDALVLRWEKVRNAFQVDLIIPQNKAVDLTRESNRSVNLKEYLSAEKIQNSTYDFPLEAGGKSIGQILRFKLPMPIPPKRSELRSGYDAWDKTSERLQGARGRLHLARLEALIDRAVEFEYDRFVEEARAHRRYVESFQDFGLPNREMENAEEFIRENAGLLDENDPMRLEIDQESLLIFYWFWSAYDQISSLQAKELFSRLTENPVKENFLAAERFLKKHPLIPGRSELRARAMNRREAIKLGLGAGILASVERVLPVLADEPKKAAAVDQASAVKALEQIVRAYLTRENHTSDSENDYFMTLREKDPAVFHFVAVHAFVDEFVSRMNRIRLENTRREWIAAASILHPKLPQYMKDFADADNFDARQAAIDKMNDEVFAPQGVAVHFAQRVKKGSKEVEFDPDYYKIRNFRDLKKVTLERDGKKAELLHFSNAGLKEGHFVGLRGAHLGCSNVQVIEGEVIRKDSGELLEFGEGESDDFLNRNVLSDEDRKKYEEKLKELDKVASGLVGKDISANGKKIPFGEIADSELASTSEHEYEHGFNHAFGFHEQHKKENAEEISAYLAQLSRARFFYSHLVSHGNDIANLDILYSSDIQKAKVFELLYRHAVRHKFIEDDETLHGKGDELLADDIWWRLDHGRRIVTVTKWLKALGSIEPEMLRTIAGAVYRKRFGRAPSISLLKPENSTHPIQGLFKNRLNQFLWNELNSGEPLTFSYKHRDRLRREFGGEALLMDEAERIIFDAFSRVLAAEDLTYKTKIAGKTKDDEIRTAVREILEPLFKSDRTKYRALSEKVRGVIYHSRSELRADQGAFDEWSAQAEELEDLLFQLNSMERPLYSQNLEDKVWMRDKVLPKVRGRKSEAAVEAVLKGEVLVSDPQADFIIKKESGKGILILGRGENGKSFLVSRFLKIDNNGVQQDGSKWEFGASDAGRVIRYKGHFFVAADIKNRNVNWAKLSWRDEDLNKRIRTLFLRFEHPDGRPAVAKLVKILVVSPQNEPFQASASFRPEFFQVLEQNVPIEYVHFLPEERLEVFDRVAGGEEIANSHERPRSELRSFEIIQKAHRYPVSDTGLFRIGDPNLREIALSVPEFREKILTPERMRYFRGIKRMANPDNQLKTGDNVASAADGLFWLATNATTGYFYDDNKPEFHSLVILPKDEPFAPYFEPYLISMSESMKSYIAAKAWSQGSASETKMMHEEGYKESLSAQFQPGRPPALSIFKGKILAPLLLELFALGVQEVHVEKTSATKWKIDFDWKHPDDSETKKRTLYFQSVQINFHDRSLLNGPPDFLRDLDHPVEIFFEKAFDASAPLPGSSRGQTFRAFHNYVSGRIPAGGVFISAGEGSEAYGNPVISFPDSLAQEERDLYEQVPANHEVMDAEASGLKFGYGKVSVSRKKVSALERSEVRSQNGGVKLNVLGDYFKFLTPRTVILDNDLFYALLAGTSGRMLNSAGRLNGEAIGITHQVLLTNAVQGYGRSAPLLEIFNHQDEDVLVDEIEGALRGKSVVIAENDLLSNPPGAGFFAAFTAWSETLPDLDDAETAIVQRAQVTLLADHEAEIKRILGPYIPKDQLTWPQLFWPWVLFNGMMNASDRKVLEDLILRARRQDAHVEAAFVHLQDEIVPLFLHRYAQISTMLLELYHNHPQRQSIDKALKIFYKRVTPIPRSELRNSAGQDKDKAALDFYLNEIQSEGRQSLLAVAKVRDLLLEHPEWITPGIMKSLLKKLRKALTEDLAATLIHALIRLAYRLKDPQITDDVLSAFFLPLHSSAVIRSGILALNMAVYDRNLTEPDEALVLDLFLLLENEDWRVVEASLSLLEAFFGKSKYVLKPASPDVLKANQDYQKILEGAYQLYPSAFIPALGERLGVSINTERPQGNRALEIERQKKYADLYSDIAAHSPSIPPVDLLEEVYNQGKRMSLIGSTRALDILNPEIIADAAELFRRGIPVKILLPLDRKYQADLERIREGAEVSAEISSYLADALGIHSNDSAEAESAVSEFLGVLAGIDPKVPVIFFGGPSGKYSPENFPEEAVYLSKLLTQDDGRTYFLVYSHDDELAKVDLKRSVGLTQPTLGRFLSGMPAIQKKIFFITEWTQEDLKLENVEPLPGNSYFPSVAVWLQGTLLARKKIQEYYENNLGEAYDAFILRRTDGNDPKAFLEPAEPPAADVPSEELARSRSEVRGGEVSSVDYFRKEMTKRIRALAETQDGQVRWALRMEPAEIITMNKNVGGKKFVTPSANFQGVEQMRSLYKTYSPEILKWREGKSPKRALIIGPGNDLSEIAPFLETFPDLAELDILAPDLRGLKSQIERYLESHSDFKVKVLLYEGTALVLPVEFKKTMDVVVMRAVASRDTFTPTAARRAYEEVERVMLPAGVLISGGAAQWSAEAQEVFPAGVAPFKQMPHSKTLYVLRKEKIQPRPLAAAGGFISSEMRSAAAAQALQNARSVEPVEPRETARMTMEGILPLVRIYLFFEGNDPSAGAAAEGLAGLLGSGMKVETAEMIYHAIEGEAGAAEGNAVRDEIKRNKAGLDAYIKEALGRSRNRALNLGIKLPRVQEGEAVRVGELVAALAEVLNGAGFIPDKASRFIFAKPDAQAEPVQRLWTDGLGRSGFTYQPAKLADVAKIAAQNAQAFPLIALDEIPYANSSESPSGAQVITVGRSARRNKTAAAAEIEKLTSKLQIAYALAAASGAGYSRLLESVPVLKQYADLRTGFVPGQSVIFDTGTIQALLAAVAAENLSHQKIAASA